MIHAQLIAILELLGIPSSPFMHYWTIEELTRYVEKHTTLPSTPHTTE